MPSPPLRPSSASSSSSSSALLRTMSQSSLTAKLLRKLLRHDPASHARRRPTPSSPAMQPDYPSDVVKHLCDAIGSMTGHYASLSRRAAKQSKSIVAMADAVAQSNMAVCAMVAELAEIASGLSDVCQAVMAQQEQVLVLLQAQPLPPHAVSYKDVKIKQDLYPAHSLPPDEAHAAVTLPHHSDVKPCSSLRVEPAMLSPAPCPPVEPAAALHEATTCVSPTALAKTDERIELDEPLANQRERGGPASSKREGAASSFGFASTVAVYHPFRGNRTEIKYVDWFAVRGRVAALCDGGRHGRLSERLARKMAAAFVSMSPPSEGPYLAEDRYSQAIDQTKAELKESDASIKESMRSASFLGLELCPEHSSGNVQVRALVIGSPRWAVLSYNQDESRSEHAPNASMSLLLTDRPCGSFECRHLSEPCSDVTGSRGLAARPSALSIEARDGDILVIGSDGFWRNVFLPGSGGGESKLRCSLVESAGKALKYVSTQSTPGQDWSQCTKFVEQLGKDLYGIAMGNMSNVKGYEDDMTVLVTRVKRGEAGVELDASIDARPMLTGGYYVVREPPLSSRSEERPAPAPVSHKEPQELGGSSVRAEGPGGRIVSMSQAACADCPGPAPGARRFGGGAKRQQPDESAADSHGEPREQPRKVGPGAGLQFGAKKPVSTLCAGLRNWTVRGLRDPVCTQE
ncbi:hypothetical protein GUITHDRAFT_133557 [Guillardia theta CCMP2712]|uniref:PPM-type phosphatase domain-containing protein n=1 Tax=Guillardia theta (strain CCMP2712) TaxID=905079 RepID=L1JV71_GUITC|nr:hypothetical protein GUITHDRAFT_133557 [Guillardia theta CCMP2712]EKX52471.1 hypothetical protein GUITHDRAFT_133557 [Guillardia theta CCMP2712]|eukprot:XP_005839451.1 hypothetical protein GUITHDRAFT_133557 [Guillardia theta CCMP2712]